MRLLKWFAASLCLAGTISGGLATAQPPANPGQPPRDTILKDANGDSIIEASEVQESAKGLYQRLLQRHDANDDGKLQTSEIPPFPRANLAATQWRQEHLRTMDADKDGVVTRKEFKGWVPAFDRLDTNGDDELDSAELAAANLAPRGPRANRPLARPDRPAARADAANEKPLPKAARELADRGPAARLARINEMDANNDGKVTRDEFKGPDPAFDHLDGDHDGTLTEKDAELREANRPGAGQSRGPGGRRGDGPGAAGRAAAAPGQPGGRGRFMEMDANNDRKISRDEFKGRAEIFDRLDRNQDGVIDAQDRPFGQGKGQGNGQGQGGGPGGRPGAGRRGGGRIPS